MLVVSFIEEAPILPSGFSDNTVAKRQKEGCADPTAVSPRKLLGFSRKTDYSKIKVQVLITAQSTWKNQFG